MGLGFFSGVGNHPKKPSLIQSHEKIPEIKKIATNVKSKIALLRIFRAMVFLILGFLFEGGTPHTLNFGSLKKLFTEIILYPVKNDKSRNWRILGG